MKPCQSNKNQSTQKRGNTRNKNGRNRIQEDKRTTKEGESQGEHQVPKPPPIMRSISNKERGISNHNLLVGMYYVP
jgi:hypothetical protein